MYPKSTTYLLVTEDDQDELFDWLREKMGVLSLIGWPSIIAKQNDKMIGCIITQAREDVVICGPIYADSSIVAIRLMSIYEDLMVRLGIQEYWFSIADPENNVLLKLLQRKNVPLIDRGVNDGQHWFKRRIS